MRILAGRNAVLEALRANNPIEKILIRFGTHGDALNQIRSAAKLRRIPVVLADKEKIRKLTGGTVPDQGIIAIVAEKEFAGIGDLFEEAARRNERPLILVCDGIEDPQNLGALIRTADCAGFHGVIFQKHHSAGISTGSVRASAGAIEHMMIVQVPNLATSIEELKERGVWIIGSDGHGDRLFSEADYRDSTAIIVGSEGKGVRPLIRSKCDAVVRIPLFGKVDSLNASVAGGLLMYEAVRQRTQQAPH